MVPPPGVVCRLEPPFAPAAGLDEMTRERPPVTEENVSATPTVAVPAARTLSVLATPPTDAAIWHRLIRGT
jgi:hypothetical protein